MLLYLPIFSEELVKYCIYVQSSNCFYNAYVITPFLLSPQTTFGS